VTFGNVERTDRYDQVKRLRPLLVVLAILAVAVGALYLGLRLPWPVERPLAYWSINDRTLGVVILDAPNLSCGIARVDESSDAVRIHAQCQERVIGLAGTGIAEKYLLQATLKAPLAARTVYDGSGNLAIMCQAQGMDCVAPG
jgi:hypothetical protein